MDQVNRDALEQDVTDEEPGFEQFGLSPIMMSAIETAGYKTPSPIQAEFLPVVLTGRDGIGQAHTGTGKTAAFVIPILEGIDHEVKRPLAMVLTPTRELSEQVAAEARKLAINHACRVACIVGGKSIQRQVDQLQAGAQIVIGTPGRIIDLIGRGSLNVSMLDFVVLDEADRMLDIGFRPDIEKILRCCPTERQTMMLTATMPPEVERLARRYMRDPQMVDLSQDDVMTREVEQFYITVDADRKFATLVKLLAQARPQQALVFSRTKRGADLLYEKFRRRLPDVAHLHGDLPQPKRDSVMKRFRSGEIRLLIATDVVGRGIDVGGISHIINYDIPEYCDDYIHRVGRTGRLSSSAPGQAITFATRDQGPQLTQIEMRINLMLDQYRIKGFEPCRPVAGPKHVGTGPRTAWA